MVQPDDLDPGDPESGVDLSGMSNGACEQQRAYDEEDGQGDLRDHEDRPGAEAGRAACTIAIECRGQFHARRREGRTKAGRQARHQRKADGKGDHAPIDAEIDAQREIRQEGNRTLQEADDPRCHDEPTIAPASEIRSGSPRPAVDDTHPRCAKREAHPSSGARVTPRASSIPVALKHAISSTRPTSADNNARSGSLRPDVDGMRPGGDGEAMTAVLVRELALQRPGDPRHFVFRLVDRDAGLQASDAHEPLSPAQRHALEIVAIRVCRDRHPQALIVNRVAVEVGLVTPTIVNGRPFRRTARPMISGAR